MTGPPPSLAGKTALVTGAATGIGKAIAAGLATAGARVVINHPHTPGQAAKAVAEIESAVGTIAGTGSADLNPAHVVNPAWPPHARFPGAAGWGTVAGSQLPALWLLWRPGPRADDERAVATAAVLPVICRAPFFAAAATPGTAVADEPGHLPRVAGVPLNLAPAALVPAICALGYALHRRGL